MDFGIILILLLLGIGFYYIFELLFKVFIYLIVNIPYYVMGKNAGFDHSWLAFLPTGRDYIAFTIPHYEYNLGIFKTRNRKMVFWIWFGLEAIFYITMVVGTVIMFFASVYFSENYTSSLDSETMNDIIVIISRVISFGFSGIIFVIRSIFHWRKNYDLLITYDLEKHAIWASVLNIFCPLIMFVFSFIMVGRSPDYGMGGYYYNEIYDDETDMYTSYEDASE